MVCGSRSRRWCVEVVVVGGGVWKSWSWVEVIGGVWKL